MLPAAGIGLVLTLWACTAAGRHEVLAFFFDGVPGPAEDGGTIAGEATGNREATGPEKAGSYHKPWWEQKCASCHEGMRREEGNAVAGFFPGVPRLVLPPKRLCFKCHDRYREKFNHGPADMGACMVCHRPHQSHVAPFLLRKKDPNRLCTLCHTEETFTTRVKHAESGWEDCLDCHDPHASGSPHLLRTVEEDRTADPAPDRSGGGGEVE